MAGYKSSSWESPPAHPHFSEFPQPIDPTSGSTLNPPVGVFALRREIESLEQRIEAAKQRRVNDIEHMKVKSQRELEEKMRGKDAEVDSTSERLHQAMQEYEAESQRSAALRRELLSLRSHNSEEIGELQRRNRDLQLERDYLKSESVIKLQSDIDGERAGLSRAVSEHEVSLRVLRTGQEMEAKEWGNRIAAKEVLIKNLEYEVSSLRNQLSATTDSSTKEIASLTSTLQSLQRVVQSQQEDTQRFAHSRQSARSNAHKLTHKVINLEQEMTRIRSENQLLRSTSAKLGRLVYGKGSK